MEEWEFELRKVLDGEAHIEEANVDSLRQRIVQAYDRQERKARYRMYGVLSFCTVLWIVSMWLFFWDEEPKHMLLASICVISVLLAGGLYELQYKISQARIATLREVKQLQLQIAELAARLSDTGS